MRRRAILLLMTMAATLVLASGVALAINTIQCKIFCRGTEERDRMLGTNGDNFMYGKGRGDILKAFDGYNELYGGGGNDKLYGGADRDELQAGLGDDKLYGGADGDALRGRAGNDALDGGPGQDGYTFLSNEEGNDEIIDTALPDNDYWTGNVVTFYTPRCYSGCNSEFAPTNLTINLNSGSGPEVKNAASTITINWSDNAIDTLQIYGGGNDEITGNDVANYIESRDDLSDVVGGVGVVDAGPGDDYVVVYDGNDDTVDCGEGNDTVISDPGDTVINCEHGNQLRD